jgi:hypothetical protein
MSDGEETRPLDDGSECVPTALSLGHDICDRYSASPGVLISPEAFGLAHRIVSFGINRLPLLESIQTRFDGSQLVPSGWLGLQYVWRTTRFGRKPSTPISLLTNTNPLGALEPEAAVGHVANLNSEAAIRKSQSLPFSRTQSGLVSDVSSPILITGEIAADAEKHKQANLSLAGRSGATPTARTLAPRSERDKGVGPHVPGLEKSVTRHFASSGARALAPNAVHRHKMPAASVAPSPLVATVTEPRDGPAASEAHLQGDAPVHRPASVRPVPTSPAYQPGEPVIGSNPGGPGQKPSPAERSSPEIMQPPIFLRGKRNLPSHEIRHARTSSSAQDGAVTFGGQGTVDREIAPSMELIDNNSAFDRHLSAAPTNWANSNQAVLSVSLTSVSRVVAHDQISDGDITGASSADDPLRRGIAPFPASVVGASSNLQPMARVVAIHDALGPQGETPVVHRSATSPTRGLQTQVFSPQTVLSPVEALRVSPSRFSGATLTHRLPSMRDSQAELPASPGSTGVRSQVRSHARNNQSSATDPSRFELPTMSAASAEAKPSAVDTQQLANRVYELLVKRLASERQRRGF